MAGPLDIQRPATGLVDLLGLRALGQSPGLMSESVSGVLDLLDMYALDRRTTTQTIISGGAIAAIGVRTFTALPVLNPQPGTALLIYSAYMSYTVPAASTWSGALIIQRSRFVSLQGYTWIAGLERTAAATECLNVGRYFERPLIMLPGDVFALQTTAFSGTGPIPALYVDYAQIAV